MVYVLWTLDIKNKKIMWKENSYLFKDITIYALKTKKQQYDYSKLV